MFEKPLNTCHNKWNAFNIEVIAKIGPPTRKAMHKDQSVCTNGAFDVPLTLKSWLELEHLQEKPCTKTKVFAQMECALNYHNNYNPFNLELIANKSTYIY